MISRCITYAMPFFRKQDWDKNYEEVRSVCPLEEKKHSVILLFSGLSSMSITLNCLNTEDLQ